MTDVVPAGAPHEIELKLRGLDRLRMAGLIGEPEFERLRGKLLAAAPAPATDAATPSLSSQRSSRALPTRAQPVEDAPAPPAPVPAAAPPQPAPPPPPPPPPAAPPLPSPAYALVPAVPLTDVVATPLVEPGTDPGGAHRSHLAAVALVAALGLIAGGSAAYVALGRRSTSPSPAGAAAAATSAPAPSSAAHPAYTTIADFVPDAKAFVQDRRGLAWKSDVTVVGLPDADFTSKLLGGRPIGSASSSGGEDSSSRELKALHVIPQSTNLETAGTTAVSAGVVGFYDYKSKELYVRGTTPTPYVREVVVHELTHALQDQWFDLGRLFATNGVDSESYEAFNAVVEGDAVRIEREYTQSLPKDEQQQADAASGGTSQQQQQLASVPPALLTLLGFPYGAGVEFDQALLDARGQSSLDAAFRSPPATTAEILDPRRYLDGVRGVDVSAPAAAGTVFDRGTLGALGFVVLFEGLTGGRSQAILTASAWGGDSYVAYSLGSRSCVRDTVSGLSPGAQSTIDAALRQWLGATPSATLTSGSLTGGAPVTFTACTG